MSVVIDLPDRLAQRLSAEASQRNLTLAEYIVGLLANGNEPTPVVRTGSDLVAYWQQHGLVGSRADIDDAPLHARQLRQQAERRWHD